MSKIKNQYVYIPNQGCQINADVVYSYIWNECIFLI